MQEGYCADAVGLISVKLNSELSLLTYTKYTAYPSDPQEIHQGLMSHDGYCKVNLLF